MRTRICLESPPRISAMGIPRHGEAKPFDDYILPMHWCYHIYSYKATLELDGVEHAIRPGHASLVPPGVRMVYRYSGPSEHVYFHFTAEAGTSMVELPMVIDLGKQYEQMDTNARYAVGRGASYPAYATAALWALLWESACVGLEDAEVFRADGHPLVNSAVRHIEQRLSHPMSVEQLSAEVGVSYGYLTRLFNIWLGMPVSEYIRHRRASQAEHLLRSTTLPIKAIARSVGVPDLQQFNRLMHQMKAAGPREIRQTHRVTGKEGG